MANYDYHIEHDTLGTPPHWPNGHWTVYAINGDQIADRIVRDELVKPTNGPAYYRGDVIARHPWCGYLGMSETFDGVRKLIEQYERDYERAAITDARTVKGKRT